MSIELHILNASKKLDPYLRGLRVSFEETVGKVQEYLPISDVDLIICPLSLWTLPETGIGGFSPASDIAYIYLDPSNENIQQSLKTEIAPTIAHELYHCVRWLSSGYGKTLGEALISEGLALHFEIEFRGSPPFYATTLNESELAQLL